MLVSKENSRKIDHLDTTVGSLCIHKNHSFVHGLSSRLAANSLWKSFLKDSSRFEHFIFLLLLSHGVRKQKYIILMIIIILIILITAAPLFFNYRSGHLTNCFNLSWYAELMFQLSFANLHLVQFFFCWVWRTRRF